MGLKVNILRNYRKHALNIYFDTAEFIFDSNILSTSPGQACVFYLKDKLGDKVLGGGWISKE